MKVPKFLQAQIAFVLKQVEDGTGLDEVRQKHCISEAPFYNADLISEDILVLRLSRLRKRAR